MGGIFQHDLDAVIHPDLLGVRGRLHQGGAASGEGGAGDGKLAAGGPDRQLGGVLVLILRQTGDAAHLVRVKLFELRQGAVRIPVRKHAHGLGVAVVLLDGEGLGGGHPLQPPVDAVGGAGEAIVAGVLPVAATDAAARTLGQIIAEAGLLDGDGAAAAQRGGAGGDGQQADQRGHGQQHGEDAGKGFMFHGNSFLVAICLRTKKVGRPLLRPASVKMQCFFLCRSGYE